MKQPRVFEKSMVLDAAFEILREKGWRSVTAREIAKRLGSSTMPIYSHMKSLDDVGRELQRRAAGLLEDYQKREYSGEKLLNISIGYVAFARDEKQLFRYLFLDYPEKGEEDSQIDMRETFAQRFELQEQEMSMLMQMDAKAQENLMRNTHIYTHGLAMMVNGGVLEPWSDERIQRCLMDAGLAFYLLEQHREVKG